MPMNGDDAPDTTSKIRRRELIRSFPPALVASWPPRRFWPDWRRRREASSRYRAHFRLKPRERIFGDKERPFHRAVVSQNRTARRVGSKTRLWFGKLSTVRHRPIHSVLAIQHFRRPSNHVPPVVCFRIVSRRFEVFRCFLTAANASSRLEWRRPTSAPALNSLSAQES